VKEILTIDLELCTGCRNCELACSVAHTQSFNPKRSRIQILKDEVRNLVVPMVCLQCEKPLCQEACPNGAIVENEHGILFVKEEICIGCMNCVTACIYGGIVKACDYGAISVASIKPEGLHQRRKAVSPAFQTLGLQIEEVQE